MTLLYIFVLLHSHIQYTEKGHKKWAHYTKRNERPRNST